MVGLRGLLVALVVHVGREHVVVGAGGAEGRGGRGDATVGIAGLVVTRARRLVEAVVSIVVVQGSPIVVQYCWF